MHRPNAAVGALAFLLIALPLAADTPVGQSAPAEIAPVPVEIAAPAPHAFAYGPILAEDPDTRVRIKQLYREQYDLELAVQERIADLVAATEAEADPDLRLQLERDAMSLKVDHQIQVTEIGLEIARLNGDAERVAQYELALDHLRNPERYLPPTRDPAEAARERAREAGLE